MKPTPTPPPWEVNPDFEEIQAQGGTITICCFAPEPVTSTSDTSTIEANAALICRAVNAHAALVGAVEAALAIHDRYCDRVAAGLAWATSVHDQLRAALAAGRGEEAS